MRETQSPAVGEAVVTGKKHSPKLWRRVAAIMVVVLAAFAWSRTGILDLPSVPANLTLEATGLSNLGQMKQLNDRIWSAQPLDEPSERSPRLSEAAVLVQRGIAAYRRGETKEAIELMQQGIRLDPNNLVFANAYRMIVFRLRRDLLASARQTSTPTPRVPPELDRQPIVFFEDLDRLHGTRETKLHLAMSWVDEMLLFPALEIKAPSSVQAVELLTRVIDKDNPAYVPALFARGLNHLHRPARLVWPESAKTPPDIAAQDIGRCVAIGRRFNVGSARLRATLALSLGDSYVKAGRVGVAHSWWQIAQNLCHDDDLQAAIRRRYGWQNEEILDRLEDELDRGRSELDRPMTDLALMWN